MPTGFSMILMHLTVKYVKDIQRNWIGKSEGATVVFEIKDNKGQFRKVEIFTTRPDTIYGATYLILAPEHKLVREITLTDNSEKVESYLEKATRKSDLKELNYQRKNQACLPGLTLSIPLVEKKFLYSLLIMYCKLRHRCNHGCAGT